MAVYCPNCCNALSEAIEFTDGGAGWCEHCHGVFVGEPRVVPFPSWVIAAVLVAGQATALAASS